MKNYRVSESLRSRKSQGRRHNFEGFIYFLNVMTSSFFVIRRKEILNGKAINGQKNKTRRGARGDARISNRNQYRTQWFFFSAGLH